MTPDSAPSVLPGPDDLRTVGLSELDGDPGERLDGYVDAVARGFHEQLSEDDRALYRRTTQPERAFGVRSGRGAAEKWVATMAAFDRVLTVPGGQVPVCAISEVTVAPAYRRRGLLRTMMTRQLHDALDRGEPAAYLWVSEQAIYGRFGFGQAARQLRLRVDARRSAYAPGIDLGDGFADEVDRATALAAAAPVNEALRLRTPGWLDRPEQWWEAATHDSEAARDGAGPLRHLLHRDGDGVVDGYAHFRAKHDRAPDGRDTSTVSVREVVGATTAARARLWRTLLDLDLMTYVSLRFTGTAEGLPWWLADRDAVTETLTPGTFLRLTDVPAALAARTYAVEVDHVVEVRDDLLGDNAGRFRLRGGPEGAEVTREDASEPDVVLDVRELGSVYLGGVDLLHLLAAGLVSGGGRRRLDRLAAGLRHHVPAECLDMF